MKILDEKENKEEKGNTRAMKDNTITVGVVSYRV